MNCSRNQLNITRGSDVTLNVTLIHDEEVINPLLIDGLDVNLISGLGKRIPLTATQAPDYIVVYIPWSAVQRVSIYSLEVKGAINGLQWCAIGKGLLRYTNATEAGTDSVSVEADAYDVTMEAGYYYTDSPITAVHVSVDDKYGTPSVDVTYRQRVLGLDFHNLKGNGITSIETDDQVGDEAVNTVTFKTDDDPEGTSIQVRNGSRGNGIASSSEELSIMDGGINTYTFIDTDGQQHVLHTRNGSTGKQGDSVLVGQGDLPLAHVLGQDNTKAMSQKGVTDAYDRVAEQVFSPKPIDISSLTAQNCSLGTTTWFMKNDGQALQRHVAIPVSQGMAVRVIATSNDGAGYATAGFLTSSYSPPYTQNNPIPYVTGTGRMEITLAEETTLIVPEGCAYIVLTTVDGANCTVEWTAVYDLPLKLHVEHIDAQIDDINEEIDDIIEEISESDDMVLRVDTAYPLRNNYIATNWTNSSIYKSRVIPINQYAGGKMVIVRNPQSQTMTYAFLRLESSSGAPYYCNGTTLNTSTEEVENVVVPGDANFLYLFSYSNGVYVDPAVFARLPKADIETSDSFLPTSNVNLSDITEQNCSLGVGVWYMKATTQAQRHKAIQVTEGEIYRLSPSSTETDGFYGLLTSSYSPPYTNNNPVPYVDGTNRVTIPRNTFAVVKIPSGCSYLVINTVDGGGLSPTWKIEKGYSTKVINEPFKVRVAHWNIGGFALGTSGSSTITHEQYPVMRQKWAEAINDINADILCCCEYNVNMVNVEGSLPAIKAREAVFSLYPYVYEGSDYNYMCTAIMSNHKVEDVSESYYPHTVVPNRYYQSGVIRVGSEIVYVVITHLDHNNHGEQASEYRAEQMQELIDTFANFPYVIICADWNIHETSEFDMFANAGYSMVNHGNLGDILTYPAGNEPTEYLDNIVCKGFSINGIHVVNDNTLTDHCCVYADFTLIR